ncbi:MAG: GspH/FimT family pseudopilin [Deltaproteobacteria bacterium]|nr:GspH/FimT family pseudopilin [Deltaproteobacteria bacterium]
MERHRELASDREMQRRFRGAGGYSLFELLVVLIIIGMAAALVTPRITGTLSSTNLKTAVKKIAAVLRYARSQAVAEERVVTVRFDLDARSVSFDASKDANSAAGEDAAGEKKSARVKEYVLPDKIVIEKVRIGEDAIDSGMATITFFPAGTSTGGTLVIADDRERRFQISVDFITGSVVIAEGAGDEK